MLAFGIKCGLVFLDFRQRVGHFLSVFQPLGIGQRFGDSDGFLAHIGHIRADGTGVGSDDGYFLAHGFSFGPGMKPPAGLLW